MARYVDRGCLRSAVVVGGPLALYVATLAPTIYNLDSAELTTAAATGGIVRATGYPLYLSIGHVWSKLPVGDVGYRLNLMSALAGAGTILVADLVLRRLRVPLVPALAALGLLAVAPAFWAMSVVAEVYTVQTLLTACLILVLLHWGSAPHQPSRWALLGLVLGLAATHHAATLLLLPGTVAFVGLRRPPGRWDARSLAAVGAGFILGLLPLAYLPLRYAAEPPFNYAGEFLSTGEFVAVDLTSAQGVLWLITGREFSGSMLGYSAAEALREIGVVVGRLNRAFLGLGLGPGLVGLWALYERRQRPLLAFLLSAVLANALFFATYRVIDKHTMLLPLYLLWALLAGVGYARLLEWVDSARRDPWQVTRSDTWHARGEAASPKGETLRESNRLRLWFAPAVRSLMLAAVLVGALLTYPSADRSNDYSARRIGESILSSVQTGAMVIGWWDTVPPVQYLQLVEGRRPDVLAVNRFLIGEVELERLIRQSLRERPVYVDSIPPRLVGEVGVVRAGRLLRVIGSEERPAPTSDR